MYFKTTEIYLMYYLYCYSRSVLFITYYTRIMFIVIYAELIFSGDKEIGYWFVCPRDTHTLHRQFKRYTNTYSEYWLNSRIGCVCTLSSREDGRESTSITSATVIIIIIIIIKRVQSKEKRVNAELA